MNCQNCGCDEFQDLGYLGSRWYRRCRDCGSDSSVSEQEMGDDYDGQPDPDDDYDGQPDEAQEWHDFDPDC